MEWQLIVALTIAIPVILLPAAFIWYVNIGGLMQALKAQKAKVAAEAKVTT
jgi:hypothetical protein